MLRGSLFLLFTAAFATAALAQGYNDVQSLQYEFGRSASVAPQRPVVYAPVARGCGCAPVYPACCHPCYTPRSTVCYNPCGYPAPASKVYRRVVGRPVYYSPYCCGW